MPVPTSEPTTERQLLRDTVRSRLREAILDGTLEPGERLHDDELAAFESTGAGQDAAELQHHLEHLVSDIDTYLCSIKDLQVRDGLHVLGRVPDEEQLRGLAVAIMRLGSGDLPGLRVVVGRAFGLDEDALVAAGGARLSGPDGTGVEVSWGPECRWLQVYTLMAPGAPYHRGALAIEPMTCAPDAFNNGRGLVELEPGAETSMSCRIAGTSADPDLDRLPR